MTARKPAKDEAPPEEAPPEETPPEEAPEGTVLPEGATPETTTLITTPEEGLGEPPADATWEDPNTYPDPENPPRSP